MTLVRSIRRFSLSFFSCALAVLSHASAQDDAVDDSFSTPAAIQQRLAQARQEIQALPPAADPAVRERLQALEAACQIHSAAVATLELARQESEKTTADFQAWSGLEHPPPYPIRMVDDLREQRALLMEKDHAAMAQIRVVASELERTHQRLDQHQQTGRQLADRGGDTSAETSRLAAIEALASRIAVEEIGRLNVALDLAREEQTIIQTKLQLVVSKLDQTAGNVVFQRNELDEIQRGIATARAAAARAAAVESTSPAPIRAWRVGLFDLERDFWNARFEALNTGDANVRAATRNRLAGWKRQLDDWIEIGTIRSGESGAASPSEIYDPLEMRQALADTRRFQRRIGFAIDELKSGRHDMHLIDSLKQRLFAFWNAELYLAEQTDFIGGRKITTYRAVTVAKLARLVLILVVGWLSLKMIVAWIRRNILRRHPDQSTYIIERWVMFAGFILLVIYGLNAVHIPFTALAFLGGALAIGLGFGTQTLLKNFISGLILILERPFKVGDVVEINQITGTIERIGMRASVIKHFDGIETLVPNSALLEQDVTNWTFSDNHIRHELTVGVAYGSSPRQVRETLLAVAAKHGLVLENPAPEVRFEDFGASALVFRLLFWLEAGRIPRPGLASDLRFMIESAFTEAGIVVAFPQHDVHFDKDQPLRIELSRSPQIPKPTK